MNALAYYQQKLREKGVRQIIAGRLRWYWLEFRLNNWLVGRYVELTGNAVFLDDVVLCVENPLINTRQKGTIYFGNYEIGERKLTKRFIDCSLPTIEIGGSIGGVGCTTNRLLRDPKAHVVLECNPLVLPTLEKNRALNGCGFSIEPCALAYGSDTISFGISRDHFMMGRVSGDGDQITVPTIMLCQILGKYGFETINLISDSEGAEVEMVENEGELLRDRVKWIVIETHAAERGDAAIAAMLRTLDKLGFDIAHKDTDKPVLALVNRNL